MSSIGLGSGLKALLSARYVLDTIGHNIANANTPGYSRQRVGLTSSMPLRSGRLLIGTGVDTAQVQRTVDELLGHRILLQRSLMGGLESQLGGLSDLEALFGEPNGNGVGEQLDLFFSSISDMASSPEDPILRTGLVQAGLALTTRFNELSRSLGKLDQDAEADIGVRVEEVNSLSRQVAALNVQVGETEAAGMPANDLRDRRDMLLSELSGLLNLTTTEGPNGSVRVLVSGNTLVSSNRANEMTMTHDQDGDVALRLAGATGFIPVTGGAIGGLMHVARDIGTPVSDRIDLLARSLILELNRVHSTGVPVGGPFTSMVGSNRLEDFDLDGKVSDELLSNAGLPFDVSSGMLHVNITDTATGRVTRESIAISRTHTTVQGFLDDLNEIPHLSADLDSSGRIRIHSDAGHGFDFSRRIDSRPDDAGTFGSGQASLGTVLQGPFGLVDGDTLDLTVDPGGTPVALQISFATADFTEISQATADEIAAAINADAGAQANGITASAVDGALHLQTAGEGAGVGFRIDGGSSVAALGWTGFVGTAVMGSDDAVEPVLGGAYAGDADRVFTFRPTSDGTIGTTAGLLVEVVDDTGTLVATLDVGADYVPGTELDVADGVTVSFGLGQLSASESDRFAVDLVADSDTSDVLVALGLNSLFHGDDAGTIALAPEIERDPALIASSLSSAPGDSRLLLELLSIEEEGVAGLDGTTLGQFYGDVVGGLGFEVSNTLGALESNDALVRSLESRRAQVSGVNIDEELVDLLAYEQAFAAAAQYITVVNQLGEELLSLI